jgi:hypothetical protein
MTNNLIDITCTITGTTALICNRFTDEAALAATSGRRGSSAAQDRGTPREMAEKKLYIGLDGRAMIPQPNLMRSIVDGGKFEKVGKAQVTTQSSSMLFSWVTISGIENGAEIPIQHKDPWRVDQRAVVIPATKGRILAFRPIFDDWALTFRLRVDTEGFNTKLMRRIVDHAGKRIGLGDFRPSRKGPYGQFVVSSWDEQSAAA